MLFALEMAAQLFNRIGQVGLGVALVGGVVNSALYNGNNILFIWTLYEIICLYLTIIVNIV